MDRPRSRERRRRIYKEDGVLVYTQGDGGIELGRHVSISRLGTADIGLHWCELSFSSFSFVSYYEVRLDASHLGSTLKQQQAMSFF